MKVIDKLGGRCDRDSRARQSVKLLYVCRAHVNHLDQLRPLAVLVTIREKNQILFYYGLISNASLTFFWICATV